MQRSTPRRRCGARSASTAGSLPPIPCRCAFSRHRDLARVNQAAIVHYGYSNDEFLAMTPAGIRLPHSRSLLELHQNRGDPGGASPASGNTRPSGRFVDRCPGSRRTPFPSAIARPARSWPKTSPSAAEPSAGSKSEALLAIAGRMALVGGWSLDSESQGAGVLDELCAMHDMPAGSALLGRRGAALLRRAEPASHGRRRARLHRRRHAVRSRGRGRHRRRPTQFARADGKAVRAPAARSSACSGALW